MKLTAEHKEGFAVDDELRGVVSLFKVREILRRQRRGESEEEGEVAEGGHGLSQVRVPVRGWCSVSKRTLTVKATSLEEANAERLKPRVALAFAY